MMTDFQIGWNLYMNGDPITACRNAKQRTGWRAANNAHGYAVATAFLMEVS